jgi:hypothetical protein|tara:strand:+ start:202 stop:423 length:222 start_codon:yes stop_codon:yes gene_type:complete
VRIPTGATAMVRVVNHAATMLDQALRGCADAQHASAALTKHVRGAKNAINTPAFSAGASSSSVMLRAKATTRR